ncbi:hypothetical protein [Pectobacterium aroidearum]|uniref:hypothetical protein n=1 Tax=Pectobacterium aroidearum TaxID=1201031 RepID=UPI00211541A3|nr:hypothetical protein [Pectobacterium aroidearum]UUE44555.1 hypothetical protein L0Y28_18875 [Pectobacterium aroidearum]UUE48775.1 hypothetical protein L0Y23_18755 [Pectobacterium aroidearum]UUE52979.1 hypothetical protein L0Y30_18875 [Pectobacterium aroidearum]UUE61389.1 hypothetical protein L0Y29_18875 [Pectobacterium aroidearum]UUE65614.1 hypothetical protein L0Y22_18875 [Pectobacterium aroidearum]
MANFIGSKKQLQEIFETIKQSHKQAVYRVTQDSNGDEYHVIVNEHGEEVAEWDEDSQEWHVLPVPRRVQGRNDDVDLAPTITVIEKDELRVGQDNLSDAPGKRRL